MGRKYDYIICVDLEATCYPDGIFPEGESQDIIEIGACKLHASGEITDNKGLLIRPWHSKVSEFCTELTSLTYPQLKSEGFYNYEQAVSNFKKTYGPKMRVWASWGNYDRFAIQRQCEKDNVKYPFGPSHINVKDLFGSIYGQSLGLGMAMDYLNLPKEGRAHRGYVDAYWVGQILGYILGKIKER